MTRLRKLILAALVAAIVLAAVLAVAYLVYLPHVIRSAANAAFAQAGLENVTFDLTEATLWGAELSDLSGSGDGESLSIESLRVSYLPLDAMDGRLESIRIRDARLLLDLDHLTAARSTPTTRSADASPGFALPFERLELESSWLVVRTGGRELELPMQGSLVRAEEGTTRLQLETLLAGAPVRVNGSIDPPRGAADILAAAEGIDAAAAAELLPPAWTALIDAAGGRLAFDVRFVRAAGENRASLKLAVADVFVASDPELDVNLYDINGTIVVTDLLAPSSAPDQVLSAGRVTVAGQELSDVRVIFQLAAAGEGAGDHASLLQVRDLRFAWAGGLVYAEPFAVDFSAPAFDTRVFAERVGLREAAALVTGGEATGEGTVSGSVPLSAAWIRLDSGRETLHVDLGRGTLRADAPGNLRLGEATDDFGRLMEQSNPAFASDPILSQMKRDVMEAMRNFDFHVLEVQFHRDEEGELVTAVRLHGRGRTGAKLPVNLNLTVTGANRAVNAYLYARMGVLSNVKLKGGS